MISITRTNSDNLDFIALVKSLDAELAERNGDAHSFYDQFNKINAIKHVVIVYDEERPIACGAIKEYAPQIMEVKRMYTKPEERGKQLAGKVLQELELWAAELGYTKCILETGKNLPEAVNLYQKNSYVLIPNYGQYSGVENSVCFEKSLQQQ